MTFLVADRPFQTCPILTEDEEPKQVLTAIGTPKRRVDQVKKVVFEKNAFEFEVFFKHVKVNVETQLYFQQK